MEYWAACSSARSFARTAHSFAYSARALRCHHSFARALRCPHSFARSRATLRSFVRSHRLLTRSRARGKEICVYKILLFIPSTLSDSAHEHQPTKLLQYEGKDQESWNHLVTKEARKDTALLHELEAEARNLHFAVSNNL